MTHYNKNTWSQEEHERYLAAFRDFISWADVAARVGTRSVIQCRSHHQKIEKKIRNARKRGEPHAPRVEHRLPADDDDTLKITVFLNAKQETPASPSLPVSPNGVDVSPMDASSVAQATLLPQLHVGDDEILDFSGVDLAMLMNITDPGNLA